MTFLDAIIYGFIQGISEFLPVSSSGHLALLPKILVIEDPGVFFDLSMHVGTALSVLLYFKKECFHLIKNPTSTLTKNFLISTITTVVLALFFKGFAEEYGRNHLLIAFNLAFFGLILYLTDKYGKNGESMARSDSYIKSFLIGLSQVLALFPGVSRSGITISTGRILGLDRQEAARYSFLLSLPLIMGGFLLKFLEVFNQNIFFKPSHCLLGLLVSFLIGILSIHYFLKLISKVGLVYFMIYRIILSVSIILLI